MLFFCKFSFIYFVAHVDHSMGDDHPFMRTGTCFGGLVRDVSKKAKHYLSDFKDGFNWRCLVTIIFVFFATLAPTITFGALLEKKTGGNLGTIETLLATSICGIIFSLTAGQPLMIVGTTGPILVFEQATYDVSNFVGFCISSFCEIFCVKSTLLETSFYHVKIFHRKCLTGSQIRLFI